MSIHTIKETALSQIHDHIEEAAHLGNNNANCCFVATVGENLQPSVRIITIQHIDQRGLIFLANKNSGKIKQLQTNPAVGICFYWPEIAMQATIEGHVSELDDASAKPFWNKRDYQAQLTAWALENTKANTDNINTLKQEVKNKFNDGRPDMAESWAGYLIEPTRIEFWKNDWKKNKKRECFHIREGIWHKDTFY